MFDRIKAEHAQVTGLTDTEGFQRAGQIGVDPIDSARLLAPPDGRIASVPNSRWCGNGLALVRILGYFAYDCRHRALPERASTPPGRCPRRTAR